MSNLETVVLSVVRDFMLRSELFTALDVSNEVKKVLPNTRHKNTRDVVRSIFASDIETQNWARTPITVNLEDGTTANALLYHPLSDSWDLDSKYDAQKRAQTSFRPVSVAQAALAQAQSIAQQLAPTVVQISTVHASPVAAPITPVPMTTARTQWESLFQTQPSLFPTK